MKLEEGGGPDSPGRVLVRLRAGRWSPHSPGSAFPFWSLRLSAALYVQASLELQFRDAEALNLTLWGLWNHNTLHLRPPEEEHGDEGWNVEEDGSETEAFYCCSPGPMTSGSVARGLCLLRLFNRTALRGAAHKRPLPAEKGGCWGRKYGGRRGQILANRF